MKPFIALIQAAYEAEDEAEARLIAERLVDNASQDLEPEEGDEVWLNQLVCIDAQQVTPDESVVRLRVARNALIKTRNRRCIDQARELDKLIWQMVHDSLDSDSLAGYDYTAFLDVCEAILVRKENNPNA